MCILVLAFQELQKHRQRCEWVDNRQQCCEGTEEYRCNCVHRLKLSRSETIPLSIRLVPFSFDLFVGTNLLGVEQSWSLFWQTGPLNCLGMPACGVKQCEIKPHAPVGAVARCVGVIFTTDLDTDWLFRNLQNLTDLENNRYCPFPVVGGSVPVCSGFRIDGKSRMALRRIGYEWLDEHGAVTTPVFFGHNRP